jgi:OmcA/MtrC family decaheme c-type cytochrome
MFFLKRLLVLALTAAGVAIPLRRAVVGVSNPVVVSLRRPALNSPGAYPAGARERYLTTDEFGYIRPGFNITINGVAVGADRKVVVDLSYTDDKDQPLDRAGKVTPGPLSFSFVLAWWDPVLRQYTSYTTRQATSLPTSPIQQTVTQAGADGTGTWNDISIGHSTYTFKTVLPSGYDATKTTTLGIYATRNLTNEQILDKNYFANAEFDFRPDTQTATDKWDMIATAACNNCHNPLSAHGGSRQDVKLCVLCHSPQSVNPDTGNTVDFKVLIHKIHRGAELPSVGAGTPYQIINSHGVSDFSTVEFPQDVRNCTKCHAPPATQAANFSTYPGQAACGSCHDNVNFATGENHAGGMMAGDSTCASCHVPEGDAEFDASVIGAHTVPFKSKQLKGLTAEIVSVTNAVPGQKPTVTFRINNGDGTPVDPATLTVSGASLNIHLGGPTTDYAFFPPIRERAAAGSVFDGTNSTYVFTTAIPADATGTWTLAMDVRRPVKLNPGTPKEQSVNEAAINPIFNVAITDAAPVARRQVVDIDKCNVCHDRLALHGGQRLIVQECVICHNPNGNDSATPQPEAIDFKRFIHRLHTGEDLTRDFVVSGTNFREVRFPGDRRDCEKCHVTTDEKPDGTQQLPLRDGLLPTPTPTDFYTPMQPTATACLGCHDTREAAAHAFVNTAPFGEACGSCHAPEDQFAVDKVHAR